MRKMRGFRSFCTCAKYHRVLCAPFIHSVVSSDCVSGQWRPWSACVDAQADLGPRCSHLPGDSLSHGADHMSLPLTPRGKVSKLGRTAHEKPCRQFPLPERDYNTDIRPASVVQLDACPTGDQEVAGSTPPDRQSWFFRGDWSWNAFFPFRWFKKGSCQFLAKECAKYWLTA